MNATATELARIAHQAGRIIMPFFGKAQVRHKADRSPVTEADEAAEACILERLQERFPDIPVVAEELAAAGHVPDVGDRFFLVDPLDGTREFISGRGEFTVNIAYVEDGRPVVGVVYAPAIESMFLGVVGEGCRHGKVSPDAAFSPESLAPCAPAQEIGSRPLRAVASRSHRTPETDAWLREHGITAIVSMGSSLKLCGLAEGAAEVYPRLGRTMEWDIAAGQAVLEAAGGQVLEAETGRPLRYGKRDAGFANPPFVAWAPGVTPF